MPAVSTLLTRGAATEGQLLTERKIYDTLIEAVNKKMLDRSLAAIYIGPGGIPGSSVDIDTVDPDSQTVYRIAEGAEVPLNVESYSSFNMKPVKYGVRPLITREMQEDSKWDLIAHNVRTVGTELAENETALIVTDALDNAGNTQAGGANITVSDITRAMQYLEDNDYNPTDIIVGPEVANDLRNIDSFSEWDKSGGVSPQDNLIGTIYGMNVIRVSGNLMTTTTSYVIDKEHAYVITEKRPITIERYDDHTHDMTGVVVTQRLKVRQLRANAICKITTS